MKKVNITPSKTTKKTKSGNKKTNKNRKPENKKTKTTTKKGGNNIRKNILENKNFDFKISNTK
tara:strand:+ start:405 stop:593 length:189 start_codon:yes stop_codon:yes gene_type:complete